VDNRALCDQNARLNGGRTEEQLQRLKRIAEDVQYHASHLRWSVFKENVSAYARITYLRGFVDALEIKAAPVPSPEPVKFDSERLTAASHRLETAFSNS
jgi:hypothetical protein